ncbi:myosin heavy chain, fast skeletal muscle isoform X2 [Macadamia integrifolia]|nr:myosin heavy chain, fast skeletal muscle isoform X2 [Macadamia integrifolia]XP_042507106.1 myosin heavy chain, fast skeletal muscle isoform X2 [Macadamia integrifolia]
MNLQEELSEAYRIKSQLADLHSAEVSKNMEAEKQVKYFQGSVAAAFAERDNSIMEAEKAKEKEEIMSMKLNDLQKRLEELTTDTLKEKELLAVVQIDSAKLKEQNETLLKVVDKFYEIRQSTVGRSEDNDWHDKCACLLEDSSDMWRFDASCETSTSKYIGSLEEELETLRSSVYHLQKKFRVGLEIENHLKKKVSELDKKRILSDDMTRNRISELRKFHDQLKCEVMDLLEQGKAQVKSILDAVEEKMRQFHISKLQNSEPLLRDEKFNDIECRDVHMTGYAQQSATSEKKRPFPRNTVAHGDTSDVLVQALQEKVAALLLLSQQEERHLLEKNVNAALQRKIEELQRNLLQVTNEKVKALVELAQLKQECQLLRENASQGIKRGNFLADLGDNIVAAAHERDGKLKNMLKKTYLRRWIGRLDEGDGRVNENEFTNKKSNHAVDFARMKVENASLKESIESMDHLTSTIRRLRLSILKAKESTTSQGLFTHIEETLDNIVAEAKLVKTALGSSLPVSWSEADPGSFDGRIIDEPYDGCGETVEKVDSVSAAGLEMVELVILACQIVKENTMDKHSRDES